MFKRIITTLFILCLSTAFLSGAVKIIVETDDISLIDEYRTPETLIFFDLDDVVFTTEGYLGHSVWFYQSVKRLVDLGLEWSDATAFMSDLDNEVKRVIKIQLLDPRTPKLIHDWQQSHHVLGLTSRHVNLAEITFRMLNELGVDFAHPNALASTKFESFSSSSCIEKNIIFVSDYHSKGELANHYLNQLPKLPSRIVFIDDKEKHLIELMEALPQDIEFIGIRYSLEDSRKERFITQSQTPDCDLGSIQIKFRFFPRQMVQQDAFLRI